MIGSYLLIFAQKKQVMGLNIKAAIKAHGLEVREIASRMGITPTALSQHINGKMYKGQRVQANPSLDILQRIADAIGCEVIELFDTPHLPSSDFTALIKKGDSLYSASSVEELEALLPKIR